jgi:hypothetical protein
MRSIKAFDELLAMNVFLVGRAAIPKMGVSIYDEDFLAALRPVHRVSPVVLAYGRERQSASRAIAAQASRSS